MRHAPEQCAEDDRHVDRRELDRAWADDRRQASKAGTPATSAIKTAIAGTATIAGTQRRYISTAKTTKTSSTSTALTE